MTEWREVVCGTKVTSALVQRVQTRLKALGYEPGPIDNILGSQTKTALIKYQKDKNLAQGQLSTETLKSLGIEL